MTFDDRGDPGAPARPGFGDLEGSLSRSAGNPGAPLERGAPALRLHPWVEMFPAPDGDVYLLRSSGDPDVAIRSPTASDRRLLEHLAAGGAVPAGGAEEERLAGLRSAGLLVERAASRVSGPDAERFSRQLPYLDGFTDSTEAMKRVRGARVCVVGCGGLGTWALAAMASMGVGAFTVADDDSVELSNLNRQVLFSASDIGTSKVDRAADWLTRFDHAIRVTTSRRRVAAPEDVAELLEEVAVLVLAADWPPYELGRWVNEACVAAGVPFITAGQQPPLLRIGPTYTPGEGACFTCHERQLEEGFPLYRQLTEHRREHGTTATTLGPASGLVGSTIALEVLHLLAGASWPLATRDRALLIDMRTLETRWETINRYPDCATCA